VHFVVGRHESTIEYLTGILKRAGTRQLKEENRHPLSAHTRDDGRTPSPWTDGGWVRYLNSAEEIIDAIDYVRRNPTRIGRQVQEWNFVIQFTPDV